MCLKTLVQLMEMLVDEDLCFRPTEGNGRILSVERLKISQWGPLKIQDYLFCCFGFQFLILLI